ncbi:thioredoxin-dependent thiol peroxidase [Marispirochaeta aestuarii]|uniref:thioredoxin-dependent peroxiredoxin n=1 Tax=Marispirochaeta aestuarii TaxID=1963862 RepID=A0A1Y1S056_9SPIO|nr:thioredoxin-dependent thiol peroxidase [Marispirochaeta aestuarii]ORC36555.1 thioredoxin-dependent thiol peroxidase [Marispirochaeta aestuarii]
MVEEGTIMEDFSLQDSEGKDVSLSDFSGKKVVVYFYPKDNTPGCTREACSFRDNYDAILDRGAVVLGISTDSVKSHGNFKKKYDLPFILLSDPDKTVLKRFGAWGEKKMYGKSYEGILRSTFILDENRKVLKVFPKVSPADHGTEILEYL